MDGGNKVWDTAVEAKACGLGYEELAEVRRQRTYRATDSILIPADLDNSTLFSRGKISQVWDSPKKSHRDSPQWVCFLLSWSSACATQVCLSTHLMMRTEPTLPSRHFFLSSNDCLFESG